jgi:hypothetical protein
MFSSVYEPPSIDLYGRLVKYLWYLYMVEISLEENDMKWDPCLERNTFLIIKDISYKSSKIKCPTSLETKITESSQVVAICCTHNNSPFSLTI